MNSKSPYHILVRPVITEKALEGQADNFRVKNSGKKYTFQVALDANKHEIKWAVEAAYGVAVEKVNTVLTKGKNRYSRLRGTRAGKRSDVKKAIVTLAKGQEISFSE